MDTDDLPAPKNWVAHKPEQRLSIVFARFLSRCLSQPCYFTALHDADGTKRTDNSRTRDKTRGVKSGQLDWDVVQGNPLLVRKVELKRGRNTLSDNQRDTIKALTECGAPPVVGYTITQLYEGLVAAGFRFEGHAPTVVQQLEAQLDAMDREAALKAAGTPTRKAKSRPKKAPPRYLMNRSTLSRARKAGILI